MIPTAVPIRRKLSRITLITTGAALLVTTVLFLAGEVVATRQSSLQQLQILNEAIASNSTAALAFDVPEDARTVLSAFRSDPHIVAAALYKPDGQLFVTYPDAAAADAVPQSPGAAGYSLAGSSLIGVARKSGFRGYILGGNAFNSSTASAAAGKDGAGAQSAAAWYAGSEDEANVAFVEAYEEAYGEAPDQFAAQAYTGVQLLAEAARNSDLTFDDLATDRSAVVDALSDVTMPTPLGEFAFTGDHDVSQPIWIVQMDGAGGFELVEQVEPATP